MATRRRRHTEARDDRDENDDDFVFKTEGFRVYRKHGELIEKAAALSQVSKSDYLRKVVMRAVSADLGIPTIDYAEMVGSQSLVQEAARRRGMTIKEFRNLAVRELAAKDLTTTTGKLGKR